MPGQRVSGGELVAVRVVQIGHGLVERDRFKAPDARLSLHAPCPFGAARWRPHPPLRSVRAEGTTHAPDQRVDKGQRVGGAKPGLGLFRPKGQPALAAAPPPPNSLPPPQTPAPPPPPPLTPPASPSPPPP